jgi:hypothetical protein
VEDPIKKQGMVPVRTIPSVWLKLGFCQHEAFYPIKSPSIEEANMLRKMMMVRAIVA